MHQAHCITPEYRHRLNELHSAAVKAMAAGNDPACIVKRLRRDYQNAWWTYEPDVASKVTSEARRRRNK